MPEPVVEFLRDAPRSGPLIVHDRKRARCSLEAADSVGHQVQRFIPPDGYPRRVDGSVCALERMKLPLRAIEPLRKSIGLGAEVTLCEFVIGMSLKLHHAAIVDVGNDSAPIRTIQRARSVDLFGHWPELQA